MPPAKPTSKAVKKRKYANVDPSQPRMDQFLTSHESTQVKDDPMEIDSLSSTPTKVTDKNTVLGTVRQQSLTPSIVITNPRPDRLQTIPDNFFKNSWTSMKSLIADIFSKTDFKGLNYHTVSKLSENLCRHGKSKVLFEALKEEIQAHVVDLKKNLLSVPVNQEILVRFNLCWTNFCSQLTVIRNVFMELDRTYILPNTKFNSIIQLGKHIFSDVILDTASFRSIIVSEVLLLIKQDRDNLPVDIKLIHSVLQMLIELSFYPTDFEAKFLTSTNTYYAEESNRLINDLALPDYIKHAHHRRTQESVDRIRNYLDMHTKQALVNVVSHQLVYSKVDTMIRKGFDVLLSENMLDSLKLFYDLLLPSPKLSLLRQAFAEYIKTEGVDLIKHPSSDPTMIIEILKFKKDLDTIVQVCFENDVTFQNALKESFEYFINSRANKPAELLAKFIDSKLKNPLKKQQRNISGGPELDIAILDSALVLFRYIQGKDAFEAHYKRFLAKRLLMDRSASSELELRIIERLKAECGQEFTKNLESMFGDMKLSYELNNEFKVFKPEIPRMPLVVKVVSQAIWPVSPASDIVLPPQMLNSQGLYTKFYTSKFNGKKLIWQNSLSSCVITAHYPQGSKEINMSLSQAAVLLLFNTKKSMTFSEISKATNLDIKELSRLLASLSTGVYNLLVDDTVNGIKGFKFNEMFQHNATKLRIPPAVLDPAVEEQKVEEKVFKNRQHQVDAAIVRIMKEHKTMSHTALMTDVLAQLMYPVDAADVKKRIDSLIEKDYLTRDTGDTSLYIYQS